MNHLKRLGSVYLFLNISVFIVMYGLLSLYPLFCFIPFNFVNNPEDLKMQNITCLLCFTIFDIEQYLLCIIPSSGLLAWCNKENKKERYNYRRWLYGDPLDKEKFYGWRKKLTIVYVITFIVTFVLDMLLRSYKIKISFVQSDLFIIIIYLITTAVFSVECGVFSEMRRNHGS